MIGRIPERAFRIVAERRIDAAITAGGFDGLRGAGRPIRGIDEPYDESWWIRGWIARELSSPKRSR